MVKKEQSQCSQFQFLTTESGRLSFMEGCQSSNKLRTAVDDARNINEESNRQGQMIAVKYSSLKRIRKWLIFRSEEEARKKISWSYTIQSTKDCFSKTGSVISTNTPHFADTNISGLKREGQRGGLNPDSDCVHEMHGSNSMDSSAFNVIDLCDDEDSEKSNVIDLCVTEGSNKLDGTKRKDEANAVSTQQKKYKGDDSNTNGTGEAGVTETLHCHNDCAMIISDEEKKIAYECENNTAPNAVAFVQEGKRIDYGNRTASICSSLEHPPLSVGSFSTSLHNFLPPVALDANVTSTSRKTFVSKNGPANCTNYKGDRANIRCVSITNVSYWYAASWFLLSLVA